MWVKYDESEKDYRQTKKKKFNIGTVVIKMQEDDCIPKGLVLKRELTIRECRHIMRDLLMINTNSEKDCYDEFIGMMNMVPILMYLKKREII